MLRLTGSQGRRSVAQTAFLSPENPLSAFSLSRRVRRILEPFAWLVGVALSGLLALAVYSAAGQPFQTSLGDPLALPQELVVTSRNADIPLPPELTDEEREEQQRREQTADDREQDAEGTSRNNTGTSVASTEPPRSLSPSSVAPTTTQQQSNSSGNGGGNGDNRTQTRNEAPASTEPARRQTTTSQAPATTQAPERESDNGAAGRIVDFITGNRGGGQ
jgi:hypothetical protein